MRRTIIIFILSFFPIFLIENSLFALEQETGMMAKVIIYSAPIRAEPKLDGSIIKKAKYGETFVVLGKEAGWYKVSLPDDKAGWIFELFIEVQKSFVKHKEITTSVLVAEGIGGFAGGVIGTGAGVALILVGSNIKDPEDFLFTNTKDLLIWGGIISLVPGFIFGTAYGVSIVGDMYNLDGSFWEAAKGAALGTIVGALSPTSCIGLPISPLTGVIGAVYFYNKSRGQIKIQSFYQHFNPPSFSFKTEKTKEGETITTLDLRVINVRF